MMEILSPLLLMTLLVWGYSRSVEEHYHAEMFVNQSLPLSFLLKQELLSNSKSLLQLCPPSLLAQQVMHTPPPSETLSLALSVFLCSCFEGLQWQHLSVEELGLLVELMRQQVLSKAAFRNLETTNFTQNLPPGMSSPGLAALSIKCIESAMQVSTIVKTFNAYNGPTPVPSFDAFVQAHKLIQRTLSESPRTSTKCLQI